LFLGQISRLHAQKIVEDGKSGLTNLFGLGFKRAIFIQPTGLGMVAGAPEGFQKRVQSAQLAAWPKERESRPSGRSEMFPTKKRLIDFLS